MKEHRDKMHEEIKIRLESNAWDQSVAGRILDARKSRSEKLLFSGSVVSLASAAVAIAVYIMNFHLVTPYSVNGQITAYNQSSVQDDYISYSETSSEIDTLINESYPMR